MPNPVAEVVERLRNLALACADDPDPDKRAILQEGPVPQALSGAADLLERLSRERDTGVPEGFALVPKEPTREMLKAGAWAKHSQACDGGHNIVGREAAEVCWPAMLSAAPQPPTVSTQGPSRAHFEILAEAMSEIKATSDGHSDQPIADIVAWCLSQIGALPAKSDLLTVTRERDQAREALAEDLRGSWAVVFLDGRNEHGSHVLPMPQCVLAQAEKFEAVLPDYAEQILCEAEAAGHRIGDCVVTMWNWVTYDHPGDSGWEYQSLHADLTAILCGTPDEQRARSVLHPEKEEKA